MRREHPKVLIIDHYDNLINQIDIYIENLLASIDDKQLTSAPKSYDKKRWQEADDDDSEEREDNEKSTCFIPSLESPYTASFARDELNNSIEDEIAAKVMPDATTLKNYVNIIRAKAIDEISKTRDENLKQLESNAQRGDDIDESEWGEFVENLFTPKFCFLLPINNIGYSDDSIQPRNLSFIKLYTIVVDFYLSPYEIDLLKKFIGFIDLDDEDCDEEIRKIDLNDKTLLIHVLWRYICAKLLDYPQLGNEIIKVDKETLLSIKAIDFKHFGIRINEIDLNGKLIDLTKIKSLQITSDSGREVIEDINLDGLVNLEYLYLARSYVEPSLFTNLCKLLNLRLYNCECSCLDESFALMPNLEVLVLGVDEFRHVTFESLKHLQYLSLGIENKSSKDLVNAMRTLNPELKVLYIDQCEVGNKTVDAMLDGLNLSELHMFKIMGNRIKSINKNWFVGFPNLVELVLNWNHIQAINSVDFENLRMLEVLNLRRNGIKQLDEAVFSHMKNLRSLNLDANCIKEVHPNVFYGLDKLEILYLGDCKNLRFERSIFTPLKNLKSLKIRNASLKSIDSNIFADLRYLEDLDLSSNKIVLNKHSFKCLENLKSLNLRHNRMKIIADFSFSSLSNLQTLDLTENFLENVNEYTFAGLNNLRMLVLAENMLERFDFGVLKSIPNIETISLRCNNLEEDAEVELQEAFKNKKIDLVI